MEIVHTEGCTNYGTTIDKKDIYDFSVDELLNIYGKIIKSVYSPEYNVKCEIVDHINNLVSVYGEYKHLYDCEECGDSVDEFKFKLK